MKTRIKIEQFGRKYKIYIDDKLISMEEVSKMCGMKVYRFREIMGKEYREKTVLGWLLKQKAGVRKNCKTFWHKDTPMWIPIVMKKAGVTQSNASMRLDAWVDNGDTRKLFKKNVYFDSTTGKINTGRKKHTVVRNKPKPVAPAPAPAPTPTPVVRNKSITDDNEFSDLSHLSGKSRNGDVRLAAMNKTGTYEKDNL